MQGFTVEGSGLVLVMETEVSRREPATNEQTHTITACIVCGAESLNNLACQFCWRTFCEVHWTHHMSWEMGHEGFSEDRARLWKRQKPNP